MCWQLCCHLTYLAESIEDTSGHAEKHSFYNDIKIIATFITSFSFKLAT
jgi:hypothetical protein